MAKKNAEGLTNSQVIILQQLADNPDTGLTSDELGEMSLPVNAQTTGPIYREMLDRYPNSLYGRGLAEPSRQEGERVCWFITDKGKKVALTFKARMRGPVVKVPKEVLDPLVLKFKDTIAYGLEHYDEDDLAALRKTLPQQYREVALDDLKDQILARRKQGAFADPEEAKRKAARKVIKEFGPYGTIIKEFLTEDQMSQLYALAGQDAAAE